MKLWQRTALMIICATLYLASGHLTATWYDRDFDGLAPIGYDPRPLWFAAYCAIPGSLACLMSRSRLVTALLLALPALCLSMTYSVITSGGPGYCGAEHGCLERDGQDAMTFIGALLSSIILIMVVVYVYLARRTVEPKRAGQTTV
jgi:hypothetical protein